MMRDDMGKLLIAAQSYIKRQVTIIGFKIHSRDHSISQCQNGKNGLINRTYF